MREPPLSADDIEARLDEALDPVLSSRRTATALARALAAAERGQQDFALKWVDIIQDQRRERHARAVPAQNLRGAARRGQALEALVQPLVEPSCRLEQRRSRALDAVLAAVAVVVGLAVGERMTL